MRHKTLDWVLATALLLSAPQGAERLHCQAYINEKRELVEVLYILKPSKQNPKYPTFVPVKETIVKQNARGEDLRSYICNEKDK